MEIHGKYNVVGFYERKTKKIYYVSVGCLTSQDANNVFMAFNRMDYLEENDAELADWLIDNIGKNATY